jgi:hypothetical protein
VPQLDHDFIIKTLSEVNINVSDAHFYFKRLAERLGYLSEIVVRRAFISIYNQNNREVLSGIVSAICS